MTSGRVVLAQQAEQVAYARIGRQGGSDPLILPSVQDGYVRQRCATGGFVDHGGPMTPVARSNVTPLPWRGAWRPSLGGELPSGALRRPDAIGVRMGVVDIRRRNNVVVTGNPEGPVVVLAHGFGCDQNLWRLVVPKLAGDHRVVLFDHVGSGGSDLSAWSPERYSTLRGYAEDVVELCRELDLRDVVFVGHSVAAMMGVLAAADAPELFAKLVLLVPSPRYLDDGDYRGGFTAADIDELLESLDSNYLGWSAALAPVIMGNPDRPELAEELRESFCRTDPDIARAFARATFLADNRADLARVTVPTLVVECAHDAIAPRGVGAFVQAQIPGSTLVTLDAVGHCPQLSAPDRTAAAIAAFTGARP
ncbi:alpha/beta hydrolase [Saccharothrix sp.]|uniref:alpha/beta fold hydrolase n=1 Tax=Saccharothrix sp. TaxID=1873460 RepID=UPI0028114E80|nr:alpha/beta hydrolase [Saccharothrix sp.]